MRLLLAPHNDDEALFASYIIQREKPIVIVITDGARHAERGIPVEVRRKESIKAMELLGVPVMFLGIPDHDLMYTDLRMRLKDLNPDIVYAPAVYVNGNQEHNTVGEVAYDLWGNKVKFYSSYELDNLEPKGDIEIVPTDEEKVMKLRALACYESQLKINYPHFAAVEGKSEYLVC